MHITPLHPHRHIITPILSQRRIVPVAKPPRRAPVPRRRNGHADVHKEAQARPRRAVGGSVRDASVQAGRSDDCFRERAVVGDASEEAVSGREGGGDFEFCGREGAGGGDDGVGEAGRGGAGWGWGWGCGGVLGIWRRRRRGRLCGCVERSEEEQAGEDSGERHGDEIDGGLSSESTLRVMDDGGFWEHCLSYIHLSSKEKGAASSTCMSPHSRVQ